MFKINNNISKIICIYLYCTLTLHMVQKQLIKYLFSNLLYKISKEKKNWKMKRKKKNYIEDELYSIIHVREYVIK